MSIKTRLPAPQYNYRQSLKKEDRKVYRRIALIITAFFITLLIIWFMGTSFINTLAYLQKGNPSDSSNQQNIQDLPLISPQIDKLPDAINTDTITVSGQTTINVIVTLVVNTKTISTITSDDAGNFKFEKVKLILGPNLIKVVASNKAKEKQEASVKISLDQTKPDLVVNGPVDGTNYPSSTKTVSVSGTTEANAIVHISGIQATVNDTGAFSYNLPVTSGDNNIDIASVDGAGNISIVKLKITVEAAVPIDGPQP